MTYKYFNLDEFSSPDLEGSGAQMDPALIQALDRMREACGFPFKINSGVRTPAHNKAVGGKATSDHLIKADGYSHGVDVAVKSSRRRYLLLETAMRSRTITRIGIAKTFVHLGNWKNNPQKVVWLY